MLRLNNKAIRMAKRALVSFGMCLFLLFPSFGWARDGGDNWRNLSPKEKDNVLRNYQRWQNLPPERRRRMAQRFRRLKQLPPEEREKALSEMPFWQRLDPDQRKAFTDLMERLPENTPPR